MSDAENCLSDDESEILVYVEFEGYADRSTFKNEKLKLDIVGIDSDHPIMQINGKFYEGTYRDAVGTYMFFEKDDSPIVDDPVFDTPATLKYVAKTRKLLKMERVFAMQRTKVLGDSDNACCIPNLETIKEAGVPPKYQADALKFWTNMRDDRMQALTSYLEKQQMREEKRLQGIELDSESDDDNPFAMYKPKKTKEADNVVIQVESKTENANNAEDVDESEETDISDVLEKVLEIEPDNETDKNASKKLVRKLTVIDPGPSTSKHTDPPVPSLISKKKRKGLARVVSKAKVKDVFKKPNRRAPHSKKSLQSIMASQVVDNNVEIDSLQETTEVNSSQDIVASNTTEMTEKVGSAEESNEESFGQESSSERTVCLITKKLEKQAKREAKMKEISDRLKTHKEELLKIKNISIIEQDSKTKDT